MVELRDHECCSVQPTEREGLGEPGLCIPGPALDLDQLGDVPPRAAREEISHCPALSLKSETGWALPLGRDAPVRREGTLERAASPP